MQFNCKYCQALFETEWYPPGLSDDDPQVRFRRSLCDQCEVFAWVEATSKHWLIRLSKPYARSEFPREFVDRDWSTLRPYWYSQELEYRRWGVTT